LKVTHIVYLFRKIQPNPSIFLKLYKIIHCVNVVQEYETDLMRLCIQYSL